jgi:PKD repeat protein
LEFLEERQLLSSAAFLGIDTSTQGTWKGVYGSDGYAIVNNVTNYPSYAQVTTTNQLNWTWSGGASTTNVRALEKGTSGATDRIASCWYNSSDFYVNVNLTDGQTHQISLYALDWDTGGRKERIDVVDTSTKTVLDTETISAFTNGEYRRWNVSGNVQFHLTKLVGANAVVSGLFFAPTLVATAQVPSSANAGAAVTLTGSATGGSGALTYAWDLQNTGSYSTPGQSISQTYTTPGTYTVGLQVTDAIGITATSTATITVNDTAPTVDIGGPYQGNARAPVSFAASASDPDPSQEAGLTLSWDFGDGATGAGASPTHVFTQDGCYNVVLTATTPGGLSTQASTVVDVYPSVTAGLDPTVNEGQVLNFAGTAVGSPDLVLHWDFGDGTTADGTLTPSHVYSTQGSYTATLTATDPDYGFSASDTLVISVNDVAPIATIGVPGPSLSGTPDSFTASATSPDPADQTAGFSYNWNFGDGTTGTGANPTHTYAAPGTYTVSVAATAVDGAVSSPATAPVVVFPQFVGTDKTTQGSWKGTYGADGYAVINNVTNYPSYARVTTTTPYNWTWCAAASNNVVRALQKATAGAPDRIAACWYNSSDFYVNVNLTDGQYHQVALYVLDWDSAGRSERIDVINATTKTVIDTETVSGFQGGQYLVWNLTGNVQFHITKLAGTNAVVSGLFLAPPAATLPTMHAGAGSNLSGAEGTSQQFGGSVQGGTAPYSYAWTFGDGSVGTGSLTPSHTYTHHGTYTATLTVTDSNGLEATASTSVTVTDVAPVASISGPTLGFVGTTLAYAGAARSVDPADQSAGFTFNWSFGDGSTATGSSPSHAFANPGTYTISVTATDQDGAVSVPATTTVTLYPANSLIVTAGSNFTLNEGGSKTVAGTELGGAAPYTYAWTFGDGGTASGTLTPSHTYANCGTYTATLTVTDSHGWVGSGTAVATVNNVPPTVSLTGPVQGNTSSALRFTASATDPSPSDMAAGFTYNWNFGDGTTTTGSNPSHSFTAAGSYTVSVTATDAEGAVSTPATQVIDIYATGSTLVLNAGGSVSTNEGSAATFTATLSGGTAPYTFYWNYGDGTSESTARLNPNHVYEASGNYTALVCVTDANGLTASSSVLISVANVAPTVTITAPEIGYKNASVYFMVTASDPSSADWQAGFTYNWNFGDGTTGTAKGTSETLSHIYKSAGTYTVTATATDQGGATSVLATTTITIAVSTVIPIDQTWLQKNGPAPYALTQAGTIYQLQTDVITSGTAFVILNKNITLDLNGHTVTYDNSQPIVVPNGGFEDGSSPTDIPHWNVSQAPAARRVPAMTGMWGNWMLQLANISSTQTLKSDPVSIPQANVEYTAVVTPKASRYDTTVRLSVVDTVTGAVLASKASGAPDRGFGAVVSFVPTTTDPVTLQIDVTPAAGKTVTVELDNVTLTPSRNYGVVAAQWSTLPIQLQTATIKAGSSKAVNATIKNGSIIQGQAQSHSGSALYLRALTQGFVVDGVSVSTDGDDTSPIFGEFTKNATVINSQIQGNTQRVTNRMLMFAGIDLQRSMGAIDIENNKILGRLQSGIEIGGYSSTSTNYKAIKISGNNIGQESHWTDGYGIFLMNGLNNFEVVNNTVVPVSGRGIMIASAGSTATTQTGTIHDNYVSIVEQPNLEYGTSFDPTAFRMRVYSTYKNIQVSNNTFIAHTGAGMPWDCLGGRITIYSAHGENANSNIIFSNNIFKAILDSVDPSYKGIRASQALGLSLAAIDPGTGTKFISNTFASNSISLNFGDNDSYGLLNSDVLFLNNTIAKSAEGAAVPYKAILAGNWDNTVTNIRLIDMQYTGGATAGVVFAGNKAKDVEFGSLVNVTAVDAHGNPLAGAIVSILNQDGNQVFEGATNGMGVLDGIPLVTTTLSLGAGGNNLQPVTTTKKSFTIRATSGTLSGTQTISLDGDAQITLTLS